MRFATALVAPIIRLPPSLRRKINRPIRHSKTDYKRFISSAGDEFESFHGKIGDVSRLPDPKTAPYEDCLFAAEFFPQEKQNCKTILLFPGFENRKIIQKNTAIKSGISVHVKAIPFDDLPEDIQLIQQANDFDDFDSDVYYVTDFESIADLGETRKIIRRSGITIVSPEADPKANEKREHRIKAEKERIDKIIADHGGIEKWRKEDIYKRMRAQWDADGTDTKRQKEVEGVLFSWNRAIIGTFSAPLPEKNAIKGLAALNDFLKRHGIHLIVLMWPYPEEVSADLFFPEIVGKDSYLDTIRVHLMQEFLNNDIEIIDLLPVLKEKRFDYPPLLFQAHLYDSHPASGAARIAGEEVAKILKRYSFQPITDKFSFVDIPMSLTRSYKDYSEVAVQINGTKYSFDDNSTILFAGDSFAYHPQFPSSTGAFCSLYLNQMIALCSRSGGAQKIFRTLLQEHQSNSLLDKKRVVVLSTIPSFFINREWEIPHGYPDFKSETLEIYSTFSPTNKFETIKAVLSSTGKSLDFSNGSVNPDITSDSKDVIELHLPDLGGNIPMSLIRIKVSYNRYYTLTFSEADTPEKNYAGGGANNVIDEITISPQTGKDMILRIPLNVKVLEITYMRSI